MHKCEEFVATLNEHERKELIKEAINLGPRYVGALTDQLIRLEVPAEIEGE